MGNHNVLIVVPSENEELIFMYTDLGNYEKFRSGDTSAIFTAWRHEGSLVIEVEDGKPVFNGIAP